MEDAKKYNMDDPEAVEIRKMIAELARQDDSFKIFDVISTDEVKKFEAKHDITLPDDYVWFITNVGNGGTWNKRSGYQYYFYPLEKTYFSSEGLPNWKSGQKKYSLDVLSKGCSYSFGIILSGEHYGEISDNGDGLAYYYDSFHAHGFKELYVKWLTETYAGYDEHGFECRLYGTVEGHLEQYQTQHDPELLSNIFSKVNKRCATKIFISNLYDAFRSETKNEHKVLLARILIKSGYEDVFSLLNEIFSPENYESVIWEMYSSLRYFNKRLDAEGVMDHAGKFYPMLIKAMKYYETAEQRNYFKYCFLMTVMNPRFNENDIMGVLTSANPEIIKYMAVSVYQKSVLSRVGKYIEEAKKKYAQIKDKL